ncbi:unnamed protein product, partial [Tuber aestivum]
LVPLLRSQGVGHIAQLSNILCSNAERKCTQQYPFKSVAEFIESSQ